MRRLQLTLDGELGEILLADLYQYLADTLTLFGDVDRNVSGSASPTLAWYVADVSRGSIALEVEARARKPGAPEDKIADAVVASIEAVTSQPSRPRFLTDRGLGALHRLGNRIGSNGVRALKVVEVNRPEKAAHITENTGRNAAEILRPKSHALTAVIGRLEQINVHKRREFRIYDRHTGRATVVMFESERLREVAGAIGQTVIAAGDLGRGDDGEPRRLKLADLEVIDRGTLPSVLDISGSQPDFTGGLSSDEYVRQLRDDE